MKCSVLLLLMCAGGCGGHEAQKPVSGERAQNTASPKATAATGSERAPSPSPEKPAPLVLELRVERMPDGVGLRVINTGEHSVELAPEVALERITSQGHSALSPSALKLMLRCGTSGCVTLAPGAEIDAPSWLGQVTGERCDKLYKPEAPGSYRLHVRACKDGAQASQSFEWPAP